MNQLFKNTTTMKSQNLNVSKHGLKQNKKTNKNICIEVHMQRTVTVNCSKQYKTEHI